MQSMNAIVLVSMFAVLACATAAQERKPAEELAPIFAVEEQERDLAKAEAMYREALAGTALSAGARELATLRLAELLMRLGRRDDAKLVMQSLNGGRGAVVSLDDVTDEMAQDAVREAELRAKARELVKQILAQPGQGGSSLPGVQSEEHASQLLWIGAAAVPEVAAALVAERDRLAAEKGHVRMYGPVGGLAAFVWVIGDAAAAAHLRELVSASPPEYRAEIYRNAGGCRSALMRDLAVEFVRAESSEALVTTLLAGDELWRRIDLPVLIDLVRRKGPRTLAFVLERLGRQNEALPPGVLVTLHGLVRQALSTSDPELGQAVHEFLLSPRSQASLEGVELLLQQLPHLRLRGLSIASPPLRDGPRGAADPTVARRLWPQLVDAVHKTEPGDPRFLWLLARMQECAVGLDATIVPDVLAIVATTPATTRPNPVWLLEGKISGTNAVDVLAAYARTADPQMQMELLLSLSRVAELPASMFEPLARLADEAASRAGTDAERLALDDVFTRLLAATGDAHAAPRVLAHRARVMGQPTATRPRSLPGRREDATTGLLVQLARRSQAAPVREALRTLAAAMPGEKSVHGPVQPMAMSQLLVTLMAMHDESSLDLLANAPADLPRVRHPLATKEYHASSPGVTPLQYLLDENPDPPHGFTFDDIVRVLRIMLGKDVDSREWTTRWLTPSTMSPAVVGEIAQLCLPHPFRGGGAPDVVREWVDEALSRRRAGGSTGPLAGWIDVQLAAGPLEKSTVLQRLVADDVQQVEGRVRALLDDEDSGVASSAFDALERSAIVIDPKRLAANRHANIRLRLATAIADRRISGHEDLLRSCLRDPDEDVRQQAAKGCGALVDKDAVPGLIDLLRDGNESVRTAAADALQRIRFFHEQQAHWDRVLKGLDASPASAAEKLLLQGKPGAPTEQRLLAIRSLGALGRPEALPFLIEWTQDANGSIAAAAKEAITQIHLDPRR